MTLAATWPDKGAILPMPLRGSGVPGHGSGPRILCHSSVSRVSGPWPGTPDPMPIIGEPTDGLRGSPMLYEEWALSSRRESLTRP